MDNGLMDKYLNYILGNVQIVILVCINVMHHVQLVLDHTTINVLHAGIIRTETMILSHIVASAK